jgi:hypothetical protein
LHQRKAFFGPNCGEKGQWTKSDKRQLVHRIIERFSN